jgi:hypothetical protein
LKCGLPGYTDDIQGTCDVRTPVLTDLDPGAHFLESGYPRIRTLVSGGQETVSPARLTRHLRPGTLTFFGPKAEPRFLPDQHLKTDPTGEVEILRRFWQFDNPEPALAPTLLVYADLLAIGDARRLETAKLLYDQILAGFNK